jgi:murein DD-endopeptidase MepM/ murein hydrolase activator NlpD
VDYKSNLTRDFKNIAHPELSQNPVRFRRIHMLFLLGVVAVISILVSGISLDAKANKHVSLMKQDPESTLVLPIEIPDSASITVTDIEKQQAEPHWQTATVKKGDSLAAIFKRNGLDASDLHKIMQLKKETRRLRKVQPGQTFRFQVDEDGVLQSLLYDINQLETLAIQRDVDNFVASYHHKDVEKRTNHAAAVINSSLFEAGREAGLSDSLTMELANIFGWDIDFALDMRTGDHFTVIYEEHFLNGKKIGNGPILAAEFVNQRKSYKAIRYTDAGNHTDYYTPGGLSMRKAFLRTPVDFRRISSRFGKRKHPILNRMRMHTGVDYAASRGTPIRAAGDGKVVHKGTKGGYGRTVIIQHGGRYSTLYAHMNSYRRGIYVGKRVKQGQVIGYVGSSGRATGPHLHYEFRVNGAHRNPLTVKLPSAKPINSKYKPAFEDHAQIMISQMDMFRETAIALNYQ